MIRVSGKARAWMERTKAVRLMELVDDASPHFNPDYIQAVEREAGEQSEAARKAPKPHRDLLLLRETEACPYGDPFAGCGCAAGQLRHCYWQGREVAKSECLACLKHSRSKVTT